MDVISVFTYLIAFFTLLSHILLAGLLLLVAISGMNGKRMLKMKSIALIKENWIFIALVIVFAGTVGSLYFSEIQGLAPCQLCWYQRIFLYPQLMIIISYMLIKQDNKSDSNALLAGLFLPLNILGLCIAAYHSVLQITPILSCGLGEVSCNISHFVYFGYITIPVMALTAFAMLAFLNILGIAKRKK